MPRNTMANALRAMIIPPRMANAKSLRKQSVPSGSGKYGIGKRIRSSEE
jgi:hypothetical protein